MEEEGEAPVEGQSPPQLLMRILCPHPHVLHHLHRPHLPLLLSPPLSLSLGLRMGMRMGVRLVGERGGRREGKGKREGGGKEKGVGGRDQSHSLSQFLSRSLSGPFPFSLALISLIPETLIPVSLIFEVLLVLGHGEAEGVVVKVKGVDGEGEGGVGGKRGRGREVSSG